MSALVEHLRRVMDVLWKDTLYAKFKNCCFGRDMLVFLGFVLASQGLQVDEEKLQAIRD